MATPTKEQQAIIDHPRGNHARVLAVAGAGKTTTMAQMIHQQIVNGMPTAAIQVLMFNSLVRQEFIEKMISLGYTRDKIPAIDTFHSCASRINKFAMHQGLMPEHIENWSEEDGEKERMIVARIITQLEKENRILPNTIDTEMALSVIGLWKGELIPADQERAKSSGLAGLVDVYIAFERLRTEKRAFTFDDYVPIAVAALELNQTVRQHFTRGLQLVVVDEYQDINHGQQRLVELLAGKHADVVVVGDDDQTIYEWRGARPDYILDYMSGEFNGKRIIDYVLPHSFRFGPLLAQTAHNVISVNTRRKAKPLIAFDSTKQTDVQIIEESSEQANDLAVSMCDELLAVARRTRNPAEIIVLGRTYSQMQSLEAICLIREIPYCVVGNRPFYERTEITNLVDYLRTALLLDQPLSVESQKLLMNILNRPNRMLNREQMRLSLERYARRNVTLQDALNNMVEPGQPSSLKPKQQDAVTALLFALQVIREAIDKNTKTHVILRELVDQVKLLEHYENFYGKGEASHDRIDAINHFVRYVASLDKSVEDFISHFDALDSTRGDPREELIVFTTIYRTKGLEYDYVFIPDAMEGTMPLLGVTEIQVWDALHGHKPTHPPSLAIERERRLFYVGITRAKICAYIGVSRMPERGAQSKNQEVMSRFVEEMHLRETKEIMHIVTKPDERTAERLRSKLRETGVGKAMREQLTTYLVGHPGIEAAVVDPSIQEWINISRSNNPFSMDKNTAEPKPKPEPKQRGKWYDEPTENER